MNRPLPTRTRLVLLAAAALFALFAWGSTAFLLGQDRRQEMDRAARAMVTLLERNELRLNQALVLVENRARFVAALPPIDGIGRALEGGGTDPLDGTSLARWRQRLEQIGVAYLESQPDLFQVRLIGVADGGRELVRVEREADTVTVVAERDLQSKGDRDYFISGLRLPEGAVHLSPIGLNQEHGQIEQPSRPALRAALPVRNRRGEVFGVVVVNALAEPLLDALGHPGLPDAQGYVTDRAGRFLWHPQPGRAFSHELAPPGASWAGEFAAAPGVLEARGITPSAELSAVRAADGTELLVAERTLSAGNAAGDGAIVGRATLPLSTIEARAWQAARPQLLFLWGEGLIVLGLLVVIGLRWGGAPPDWRVDEGVPGGRTRKVFGLEIPTSSTGRRGPWLTLAAALLPVPCWVVLTLGIGPPAYLPRILMLIPALLAAWWGGLYAGLGATLVAAVGAWDLATPTPPLDWSTGGEPLDVLAIATLVVTGVLVTFSLETVRRRGAQLLAQARAQRATQERLVAQAPAALAMFDRGMRYLACTTRWKAMHGLAADVDLSGRSHYEVSPGIPERWKAVHQRVLAGEALSAREDHLERADGSVEWLDWECRPWRTPAGAIGGLILWVEDVTAAVAARQEVEAALQSAQNQLGHLSRIRIAGELAASIAHEVNQPIGAVVAHSGAALRWLAHQPPNLDEARDALKNIVQDADRAAGVIRGIRASLQKTPAPFVDLDINEVARSVVALAKAELDSAAVSMQIQLESGLPAVSGDRVQLQQVLFNLMRNGMDAMRETSGRPRRLVVRTSRADSESVLVQVGDTGMGLNEEEAMSLFEPFFTTKPDGLGMGLWISRSIVESHGGRLWLESASSQGAEFRFTLPRGVSAHE